MTSRSAERAHEGTTFELSCYTDPLGLEPLSGSLAVAIGRVGAGVYGPEASLRFTTKYDGVAGLLGLEHARRTRVRFSLMPEATAKLLDIRTSPVAERLAAIDDFVEAGYEVHVNLSPVVVEDGWLARWAELLDALGDATSEATKAQLACEVIFLTHNEQLHEVNLGWHPKAEDLLWQPRIQEPKRSQNGAVNVRYAWRDKQREFRSDGFYERFPAKGQIERVARIHRELAKWAGIEIKSPAKARD